MNSDDYEKIHYVGSKYAKSANFCNTLYMPDSSVGTVSIEVHKIKRGAMNSQLSCQKVLDVESVLQDKVAKVISPLENSISNTCVGDESDVDLHHAFRSQCSRAVHVEVHLVVLLLVLTNGRCQRHSQCHIHWNLGRSGAKVNTPAGAKSMEYSNEASCDAVALPLVTAQLQAGHGSLSSWQQRRGIQPHQQATSTRGPVWFHEIPSALSTQNFRTPAVRSCALQRPADTFFQVGHGSQNLLH